MIYLENNLEIQEVWIPKNDDSGHPYHGHDYEEGYADGVKDQKDKIEEITITENGTYESPNGYSPIIVEVPQGGGCNLQEKSVEMQFSRVITVTPDEGFDGLSKVNVDAKKYGDIRYNEGVNTQKAKLTDITINKNGTYTDADGYKKVVVNVDEGGKIEGEKIVEIPTDYDWEDDYVDITPSEGYDGMSLVKVDGEAFTREIIRQQSNRREDITIDKNGVYTPLYGYKKVTVNVPKEEPNLQEKDIELNYWIGEVTADEGYDGLSKVHMNTQEFWNSAEREGQQYVINRLVDKTFTENGTYEPDASKEEWGFKNITVNVPDRYQEGVDKGYASGMTWANRCTEVGLIISTSGCVANFNVNQDKIQTYFGDSLKGQFLIIPYYGDCTRFELRFGPGKKFNCLGSEAFMGRANLKDISLYTAFFVRDRAFKDCISLDKVTLGPFVQELGEDVFNGCTSLTEIVWRFDASSQEDTYPIVKWNTFRGMAENGVLYVPNVEKYARIQEYLPNGWTIQPIE